MAADTAKAAAAGGSLRARRGRGASTSPERRSESPTATSPSKTTPTETTQMKAARFVPRVALLPSARYEILVLLLFCVLSIVLHFYNLGEAKFVVWDEAHFGKFAGYYLKHTFYFDVHPPLGKMLNAFGGLLAHFNGTFEFDSGVDYPPDVNYTIMRAVNALFGALTVPLAYLTAHQMHFSFSAKCLVTTMTLLDTALLCISRFILLDSMLLFFTCWAVFCLSVFHNCQRIAPFSLQWYYWIFQSGISLGLVLSVKWVGLFVIAVVGLNTIDDLWEMFADLRMPTRVYIRHWATRIIALILVPLMVYALTFVLHFAILDASGPGDANMSSLFQAGLRNSPFEQAPDKVAYGSKVTFKNNGRGGGLLHSHVQTYPVGSQQQQVTCYHHKDHNNNWVFMRDWTSEKAIPDEIQFVKSGDLVRLFHDSTGRNLHSHPIPAPITRRDFEVSGYGNITVGDNNDLWRIEKLDDLDGGNIPEIRTLVSRFNIRHAVLNCFLKSHSENLPQWGFKQLEVTCDRHASKYDAGVIWNIELHENSNLPLAEKGSVRSKFHNDFWDVNVGMWTSNNALTPDPDKEDNLVSVPYQWPLMLTALRMCGWRDDAIKFLLIGNPVVWLLSSFSIVVYCFVALCYIIMYRRQIPVFANFIDWDDFRFGTKVGFLGWVLHYLPFFLMGRVTYLHHYFPALYFAILNLGFIADHLSKRFFPRRAWIFYTVVIIATIANFVFFKDFALGMRGPAEQYGNRQWYSGWRVFGDS